MFVLISFPFKASNVAKGLPRLLRLIQRSVICHPAAAVALFPPPDRFCEVEIFSFLKSHLRCFRYIDRYCSEGGYWETRLS